MKNKYERPNPFEVTFNKEVILDILLDMKISGVPDCEETFLLLIIDSFIEKMAKNVPELQEVVQKYIEESEK